MANDGLIASPTGGSCAGSPTNSTKRSGTSSRTQRMSSDPTMEHSSMMMTSAVIGSGRSARCSTSRPPSCVPGCSDRTLWMVRQGARLPTRAFSTAVALWVAAVKTTSAPCLRSARATRCMSVVLPVPA